MSIKDLENEVVSITSILGEFVGKFEKLDESQGIIVIKDARRFVITQDQQVGFYPSVSHTASKDEKHTFFPVQGCIFTKANKDIVKLWEEQTSQIQIASGRVNK